MSPERTVGKKLYELDDMDKIITSLKEGRLQGISGDPENPDKDRIVFTPPSMGGGVFLDLPNYLTILISQGYQVIEGKEELKNLTPFSGNIVLSKEKNNK